MSQRDLEERLQPDVAWQALARRKHGVGPVIGIVIENLDRHHGHDIGLRAGIARTSREQRKQKNCKADRCWFFDPKWLHIVAAPHKDAGVSG